MRDAVRLAFGTLTVLPVRAPERLDRESAGLAMTLGPVVGLALSLPAAALVWALSARAPLLAAVLAVGLMAGLTRAIHLDGLADTADGLGSGRPAAGALEIMRRSDIGPFGVVTLVLVLLLQVVALSTLAAHGDGVVGVVSAVVVSRAALPVMCSGGVPSARPEGLGSVVAGSVGRGQLLLALTGTAVVVAALAVVGGPEPWWGVALAGLAGLAVAATLTARCVRRLGGVTGDVLGAGVEAAAAAVLVVGAVVL